MNNKHTYIKHSGPAPWVLFLMLCIPFMAFPAIPLKSQQEIDSLQNLLPALSDPRAAIPVLSRLADLAQEEPEKAIYLKQQYALASQIDSIEVVYKALSGLAQYYYNIYDMRDSLVYWRDKVDSIAHSRNEYPDALFEVHSFSSQDLLWSRNYEMALDEALRLYQTAEEQNSVYGIVRCTETLGLIYQRLRRDEDAVEAFEVALGLLEKLKGQHEAKVRIASYQSESSVRTKQNEKTAKILARYKSFIDEQARRNNELGEVAAMNREYWLLYSFYTNLYLNENNLEKARYSLSLAANYEGSDIVEGDYAINTYLAIQARYYNKLGDRSRALYYLDEVLKTERLPEDLRLKADILEDLGKIKEALVLYDELYDIALKENSEAVLRQINQLQVLHDLHEKEVQAHEMKITNQRIEYQRRLLLSSLSISFVLLVLLYRLFIYYKRAQRLKNELQQEKRALLHSENQLLEEKEKAEEASRMKSAFLANMSHEIRTPLNAIVGFSGLLVDPSTEPEEREEFTSIIHNNTDLLLNLVNDVMDLSRMETGDMDFRMDKYPVDECCRKALDSVRHRIPEGVRLTFTPDTADIIVYTDTLRLQQLLTNLLTNAAKFTREGEINLAYRPEPDGKSVCIAVTDTGCGIPPEKQAEVFKRFEKLDDYKPGAGLGLSICSIIAEHLKGRLFIDPDYRDGARFVFIHPCETSASSCTPA